MSRKDCKYYNSCGSSENCSRCDGYEKKKCVLCGKTFTEYGNDPWPIALEGKCCDMCNGYFVLAARIKMMKEKEDI